MTKQNKSRRQPDQNSRKALRKQKRLTKKQHRQEHYFKKKNKVEELSSPGKFVKLVVDNQNKNVESKMKKKTKIEPTLQDIILKERRKDKKEVNKLKHQMAKQRRHIMIQENEEEDKIIKKLEKQLGLNKSKNKNNFFADDGLDYLLEVCDKSTTEQIVAAEKHLAEVENESDFEEDLATVISKDKNKSKNKKVSSIKPSESFGSEEDNEMMSTDNEISDKESNDDSEDSDISDDSDAGSEQEESFTESTKSKNKVKKIENTVSEKDLCKVFSDDEISHLSSDDEDIDDDNQDSNDINSGEDSLKSDNEEDLKVKQKPNEWEDIYGRKRDKDGNVIKEEKGSYVPPHLRNKDSSSDKDLAQLKRQVKSVLNKLTGTNLHWACTSIDNLYSSHSRHSVNTSLYQCWLDGTLSSAALTPDRLVCEHAALVCVLHANVSEEIGAHFLLELSKKFDELLQVPQPVEDKTLDNVVLCLSHLFGFKIFHASLLYDILSRLLEDITEKCVDCILVCLRSVGGSLRKEEPLALRDYINQAQEKARTLNKQNNSRMSFLMEILMAVKNNNFTKIPNYDPTYSEHLRKMTRSIIRKGNYVSPLNIKLEDLLKAEERGKWWIVGSAWQGGPETKDSKPGADGPQTPISGSKDQLLLELARKQRMNTDVRRSIFCVIMSAEDYMDAFEKLQHLNLKGQQEREIIHVLLACCIQEKKYNPYYAVLAQKLCDTDRKYQLSLQFSLWDKIKDLESLSAQSSSNLAQLLTHIIMEKGLPLSVLKIVQFSDLNKTTVRFMRRLLLAIIMHDNLKASLEVFHRISKPQKLHMFRESMRLFIQHFLIKNSGKNSKVLSDLDMTALKERTAEVNKILTMYESKLQF